MPYKKDVEEKFLESIADIIMAMLGSSRNTYLFKKILYERKLSRFKKESVQVAFSRLKSKGYIQRSTIGWNITKHGSIKIQKERLLAYIPSPFIKKSKHNTIVSFDIPQTKRALRDWMRNQIKIFGYKMLQQSLWIGPGPLPKEFMKRLEDLNIRQNIKTFSIRVK